MQNSLQFETAQEAAARLGLTVRAIQKHAAAGKIPGAERHGRVWMIPCDYVPAAKPDKSETGGIPDVYQYPFRPAMPLLSSAYPVGHVMEHIEAISDPGEKQIALAEYYFFSGQSEKCAQTAEPYLNSHEPALRLSASLLCTFANLSRGHVHLTRFAMDNLRRQIETGFHADMPVQFYAVGMFVATMAAVLLHLPEKNLPPLDEYLCHLPGGLKLYACYVLAHKAYLNKDYAKSLTIADIGLALCPKQYPIAAVYTHIVAAMALINMKRTDEALAHMDKAWKIAEPDGLIQPFAEHHGLLQGVMEIYFKKNAPDVLPGMIEITYAFSAGWRRIHNPDTGHDVADNLSTTEFTIAMLYNRDWAVKEIADHMDMSERTVKRHIASIYNKLGISDRAMLEKFMLR